jgi:hypothetical protein
MAGINLVDDVPTVARTLVGHLEQINATSAHADDFALRAAFAVDVDLELGRDLGLGRADRLHVDEWLVEVLFIQDRVDLDPLDQLQVVRADRIQTVQEVVDVSVGC